MKDRKAVDSALKYLMMDFTHFCQTAGGITLRSYQLEPALAIIDSVIKNLGRSFVVIFPRQSGKNELQAQIQAYLLTIFSQLNAELISISPTWKPQTFNAMRRLENVLVSNSVCKDRWSKSRDYIYQVGKASCYFLSGSPTTNIVGATANLLLSVDEAQEILIDKFDKEIAPMAASTHATRVFWGTAWTGNTLLAREEKAALEQQEKDGERRVWRLAADRVTVEVPVYGQFVAEQVAKLGRHHPLVRTQYYSEDIDTVGGLFPPERIALIYGIHPPETRAVPGGIYVMTLDIAGEDEVSPENPAIAAIREEDCASRDATAMTIARVNLASMRDPAILAPSYEIVFRRLWVGVRHTDIYAQILNYALTWSVRYLVCDATGIGAGLASFLAKSLGSLVIPFVFSGKTKSVLGWDFLSMIDTGRLKSYSVPEDDDSELSRLDLLFFKQMAFTEYEIIPGPEKKLRWGVPDGVRDPASGTPLHDDLVISAALLTVLDRKKWSVSGPAALIPAVDPLDEMGGF